MKPLYKHILEKLKVRSNQSVRSFDEFKRTRKSLSDNENNVRLRSENTESFIDFVERNLIEDGVVDELPLLAYYKENNLGEHLFRFDGPDMYDNLIDEKINNVTLDVMPPTFGAGYLYVVKFVIKYYQDACEIYVTEK